MRVFAVGEGLLQKCGLAGFLEPIAKSLSVLDDWKCAMARLYDYLRRNAIRAEE